MRFYIATATVLLAGLLVLLSTFMPWLVFDLGGLGRELGLDEDDLRRYGGPALSATQTTNGWDVMEGFNDAGLNPFFNVDEEQGRARPLFSGLCTLIAGILIMAGAVMLLALKKKPIAIIPLAASFAALGMGVTNIASFATSGAEGFSIGAGLIVLAVFGLAGLVGSFVSLRG